MGAVSDTAKGYTATLERVNTPSRYGSDVQTIRIDWEFHTAERLRVKVRVEIHRPQKAFSDFAFSH